MISYKMPTDKRYCNECKKIVNLRSYEDCDYYCCSECGDIDLSHLNDRSSNILEKIADIRKMLDELESIL